MSAVCCASEAFFGWLVNRVAEIDNEVLVQSTMMLVELLHDRFVAFNNTLTAITWGRPKIDLIQYLCRACALCEEIQLVADRPTSSAADFRRSLIISTCKKHSSIFGETEKSYRYRYSEFLKKSSKTHCKTFSYPHVWGLQIICLYM